MRALNLMTMAVAMFLVAVNLWERNLGASLGWGVAAVKCFQCEVSEW